jgi:hypothetical protein
VSGRQPLQLIVHERKNVGGGLAVIVSGRVEQASNV